ncbi:MAG: tRNA 2-selenouridine(34) synthase MnmH [Gammaproteobacteria bacterium]|nr:tRNA 2-selenouridine(34) synthase MnmH [Gammaproteobacteria bacterium]
MMREDTSDYRQLFLNDVPLMDVRAPVEFNQGAFPTASNIPLLDDLQREQVGTRYKSAGQDEAIRLGLELATVEIREQRMSAWLDYHANNPRGFLYCFRGGLRSRTTQQWMREQGVNYPLVSGGYKEMRRFLIDEMQQSAREVPLICVGGLTGVGKTRILRQIRNHVDFEGFANHRGSAFGQDPLDTQPTVINWENRVSIELLKHRSWFPGKPMFVEDEGRRIGRINMPEYLFAALTRAPRAILQVGTETRINLITEDYILHSWPAYQRAYADAAEAEFSRFVLDNLARIQKRLGGERYKQVKQCFEKALQCFFKDGSAAEFYPGIKILLEQYYDPMYRYQIQNKQPEIIFEGPEAEFLQWADEYCAS